MVKTEFGPPWPPCPPWRPRPPCQPRCPPWPCERHTSCAYGTNKMWHTDWMTHWRKSALYIYRWIYQNIKVHLFFDHICLFSLNSWILVCKHIETFSCTWCILLFLYPNLQENVCLLWMVFYLWTVFHMEGWWIVYSKKSIFRKNKNKT